MAAQLDLDNVPYGTIADRAREIADTRARGHIHTTVPGCVITGSDRRAIVLEATDEGKAYAFFDDEPIEERAKPLAVLLHGAESVPHESEALDPPCVAVAAMGERMRLGKGHFHILNPVCLVNPHPGRWTILFEDVEQGLLESVSAERPLADIRFVERLIYDTKK